MTNSFREPRLGDMYQNTYMTVWFACTLIKWDEREKLFHLLWHDRVITMNTRFDFSSAVKSGQFKLVVGFE